MADIRMIALDLDGTLLGPDGRASERNLATLRAAEDAGIAVVAATGRRHGYALRVLSDTGLKPDTLLVSSNGAVVREFGSRLVARTLMPLHTAIWLCGHASEFRNALVITFDKVLPNGDDAYGSLVVEELDELHGSIGQWMTSNEPYIQHIRPIEAALTGEPPFPDPPIQMMLCGTIERMRRAEARLLEDPRVVPVGDSREGGFISLSRTEYPARNLSIVDILPSGCSKGIALLTIAAARGITPAQIMAIGDNWNDLSMLQIAGHPVLMANAPGDLHQLAAQCGWHITDSHEHDGVAQAIESALPELAVRVEETSNPGLVGFC